MNVSFWERVERGCEILGIPKDNLYVWKSRGRVSRDRSIDLYQALQGTDYEVTLDELKSQQ